MQEIFTEIDQSPTYCRLAWSHAFVGPGAQFKPCCRFRLPQEFREEHSLKDKSLEECLHTDFMESIRESMRLGVPVDGCTRCYEEEAAQKGKSLRQIYNGDDYIHGSLGLEQQELRYLELSSSNLCNSACRMCEPRYSVRWAREWELLGRDAGAYGRVQNIDVRSLQGQLANVRHVKFTGGEPLLIPEYLEVLEELVRLGNSENIYLNYSTNLTVSPSAEIISLWKRFKYVEVAFSLDGVGLVNEYVRYPSKWEQVDSIAKKILCLSKELSVRCGLRSTVMIYNILDLPNIFSWWTQAVNTYSRDSFTDSSWINPTHVTHPPYLSLRVLPKEYKKVVMNELLQANVSPRMQGILKHFIRYMNAQDDSHLLPKFIDFSKRLDQIRAQDFRQVAPELAGIYS